MAHCSSSCALVVLDGSSRIGFEEFMQGVRDPLSARRVSLVRLAFTKLDKDGSGVVDAVDIASVYNASKHPDCIAGRKTSEQILKEVGNGGCFCTLSLTPCCSTCLLNFFIFFFCLIYLLLLFLACPSWSSDVACWAAGNDTTATRAA